MTIPASVISKIGRARQHVATAQAEVEAFIQTSPYAVGRQLEDGGATHVYRFTKYEEAPPTLSLAVGDAVHNLRSSLDHLAFGLACNATEAAGIAMTDSEQRSIQFPIASTVGAFESQVERRLKFVGSSAVEAVRQLQPFNSPHPTHHPLYCIGELDNTDKHRALSTTASIVSIPNPEIPVGVLEPERDLRSDGTWGLGAKIVTFKFAQPEPNVDVHFQPRFSVALENAWPPKRVEDVLKGYVEYVERIVIPFLGPFFG